MLRPLSLLLLFPALAALAAESPPVAVHATRHGARVGKRVGKAKAAAHGSVRGHCTLLESALNPLTGPCISVPLELRDEKGASLAISRTTAQGDFEFSVDGAGPFTIAPSSGAYVLVSPDEAVKSGTHVDLRIRERN